MPKHERETADVAAFLKRMIRAYGRRVADDDWTELATMLEVQAELECALRHAVRGQRDAGFSWAQIARGLGTSRQAAEQRFGESRAQAS